MLPNEIFPSNEIFPNLWNFFKTFPCFRWACTRRVNLKRMQTFWRWWVLFSPKQTAHPADLSTNNPHSLVFSVLLQKCTRVLTTVLSTIKCHVWSLCYINAQLHMQSFQQTNKQTKKKQNKQTENWETTNNCFIELLHKCVFHVLPHVPTNCMPTQS